ncbi:hypothetical protein D3C71_826550 [compost metagenome]
MAQGGPHNGRTFSILDDRYRRSARAADIRGIFSSQRKLRRVFGVVVPGRTADASRNDLSPLGKLALYGRKFHARRPGQLRKRHAPHVAVSRRQHYGQLAQGARDSRYCLGNHFPRHDERCGRVDLVRGVVANNQHAVAIRRY